MVKSFSYQICVDNFEVVVNQKPIRHVYLRVDSQAGPVKVSAPINFDKELIRRFVVKKRLWIREQQKKYSRQEKDLGYQYVSGEYHYVDGLSVQLIIIGIEGRPFIKLLDPPLLEMHVNYDCALDLTLDAAPPSSSTTLLPPPPAFVRI